MGEGRTVIIGLDGVPFGLMKNLSDKGIMPNFRNLREDGIFKQMESSIPEISSVSWSSIITGENPGKHGVYGFTELISETYTISFPNFNNLMEPPFWNHSDKKNIILNVPFTFPAKELDGVLIAGFVALDLERALYPQKYLEKLKEFDYRVDVDSEKAYKSLDLFLKDLFETLENRIKAYRFFWDEKEWDNFMFVITGTDRLGHFLWHAYKDKNHKYHQKFLDFMKACDDAIGEICSKMKPEDSLIMLSDHGMEAINTTVYLNKLLIDKGFLFMDKSTGMVNYNSMEPETKAFVLEPARIYLNRKGKYPAGTVEKADEKRMLKELTDIFENMEYKGQKVIKKVYRKEELFEGKYLNKAPDLTLVSNPGFSLRGSLDSEEVFVDIKEEDVLRGKHTQEDAFFLVKTGRDIKVPEPLNVTQVVGVLKQLE